MSWRSARVSSTTRFGWRLTAADPIPQHQHGPLSSPAALRANRLITVAVRYNGSTLRGGVPVCCLSSPVAPPVCCLVWPPAPVPIPIPHSCLPVNSIGTALLHHHRGHCGTRICPALPSPTPHPHSHPILIPHPHPSPSHPHPPAGPGPPTRAWSASNRSHRAVSHTHIITYSTLPPAAPALSLALTITPTPTCNAPCHPCFLV